jgi:8-oxo-dGTP pyrophosphatase MutT (NUDIX family)
MTTWRPPTGIRAIVIGLAWDSGRLLASEIRGSDGVVKGIRPLGGSIEFGETREQALRREFMEELGIAISIVGPWHAIENIFEFEGRTGHEIVFAADVELNDNSLFGREEIYTIESGQEQRVVWADLSELAVRDLKLFPIGLAQIIQLHQVSQNS